MSSVGRTLRRWIAPASSDASATSSRLRSVHLTCPVPNAKAVFFLVYLLSLTLVRLWGWMLPLAIYLAMVSMFAALESIRNRTPRHLPLMMVLFPSCHLAYAGGFASQLGLSVLDAVKARRRVSAPAVPEEV